MMIPTTSNNQENAEAILPSFFYAIASSESRPLTSWEELERIITKDPLTQARTLEYRQRLAISKQLAQEVKIQMPGITVAALMDGYGKEMRNIKKVLRNIALDYDHVDAQLMEECIRKAKADPHTKVLFVTASGRGFRIIASYDSVDDDELSALELFEANLQKAMEYYNALLGITADDKCTDITRMCGLAYDSHAYFNWNALTFSLNLKDLKKLYTKKAMQAKYAKRTRRKTSQKMILLAKGVPSMEHAAEKILKMMDEQGYVFQSNSHNEYVCHFGNICLRYGIDQQEVLNYATEHFSKDYPDTASVINSCYKHVERKGTWHFYEKGETYGKRPSAKVIKQWLSMRYEFHHNMVTGYYEILSLSLKGKFHHWTQIDDNIENSIWSKMDEEGLAITPQKLHSVINSDFSEPWDPMYDYLSNLPKWDGKKDYISELADRVTVAYCPGYGHTQERFRYYFKKWLVAMVVAWVTPNVVAQTMLIFVGRGGIFKTTSFYYTLPPILRKYFINESTANYTDKDVMEAFASKALMCCDELDQVTGKNQSAFKSNVTKLVFSIRRPYDKYRSELMHRAALCGTSNTMHLITDPENRRYCPWLVENIVSPISNPIDYTHVYSQAVALGKEVTERQKKKEDGWVYWLTNEDIQEMKAHNEMFMGVNLMSDQILRYYRVPQPDTDPSLIKFRFSSEIMERIGCCNAMNHNLAQQNLASVMISLGFRKIHRSYGNGWAVIEKQPGEINCEAIISPSEWDGCQKNSYLMDLNIKIQDDKKKKK